MAVKRIPMHDAAVAARAEREARAAARLAHPGIVALYESGSDDDAVYLVSELVRGARSATCSSRGSSRTARRLQIGVALCDALAHAHGRGVIHRDVKPANVMVCDREAEGPLTAKLTDFGVARMAGDDVLTATGDVVGTLAYMAPEQAEGGEVGAEADLYALGLVLYESLSGVNPVRGRGAAATARRLGARMPALGRLRRDLPLALCQAIDRAVLARPEDRGDLRDLRTALLAATGTAGEERGTIAGAPGLGHAVEVMAPPRPRPPLRPVARAVAGLAAGALVAAALQWLGGTPPLSPAAGAGAAALAVVLLPRLGWLAAAAAIGAWQTGDVAWVLLALPLPTVVLLGAPGRSGRCPPPRPCSASRRSRPRGRCSPDRRGRRGGVRPWAPWASGGWRWPRSCSATAWRSARLPAPGRTASTSRRSSPPAPSSSPRSGRSAPSCCRSWCAAGASGPT